MIADRVAYFPSLITPCCKTNRQWWNLWGERSACYSAAIASGNEVISVIRNLIIPAKLKSDPHLEIARALFIDVVGYSKLLVNKQRTVIEELR